MVLIKVYKLDSNHDNLFYIIYNTNILMLANLLVFGFHYLTYS